MIYPQGPNRLVSSPTPLAERIERLWNLRPMLQVEAMTPARQSVGVRAGRSEYRVSLHAWSAKPQESSLA